MVDDLPDGSVILSVKVEATDDPEEFKTFTRYKRYNLGGSSDVWFYQGEITPAKSSEANYNAGVTAFGEYLEELDTPPGP